MTDEYTSEAEALADAMPPLEARAALSNALRCFDDLQSVAGRKYQELGAERDLARAELASARQELERLRSAAHWIVARDGGRYCERCEQEIRRGEAYEHSGWDRLSHIHCPDQPEEPTDG